MTPTRPPELDVAALVAGVRERDPAVLGRAITLIESESPERRALAEELLQELLARPGRADRVGITGVPGVGKSTFIDALGSHLTGLGHRVAVLAIDPTSPVSGGSILGDKTRMARLAQDERAFIRPTPSAGSLGGVASRTRETMLLCEAAGFDVVLVETVGVGQSEVVAAEMVDFFLVLMLAGAGDELQGIKRGLLELADLVAVNKADGANREAAAQARAELDSSLHFLRPKGPSWTPSAVCVSALEETGLAELWELVARHQQLLRESGELDERRAEQLASWMRREVEEGLRARFAADGEAQALARELEAEVRAGNLLASRAAREVLARFLGEG